MYWQRTHCLSELLKRLIITRQDSSFQCRDGAAPSLGERRACSELSQARLQRPYYCESVISMAVLCGALTSAPALREAHFNYCSKPLTVIKYFWQEHDPVAPQGAGGWMKRWPGSNAADDGGVPATVEIITSMRAASP